MPVEITMPVLSPTMEEGTIAVWLVAEGDQINPGDVIAEIETDKATMEFEAPEAGTLAKIFVEAGTENVAVNTVIAMLATEGEDVAAIEAASAPETVASQAVAGTESQPVSAPKFVDTARARVFSSPLARRVAVENGVDISGLSGSGPKGRIVRADIEAVVAASVEKEPVETQAQAWPATVSGGYAADGFEVVELDNMRRTIARRLTEAKQTVPHFYLRSEVELDALLALRKELNASAPVTDGEPVYRISVNDLVIKALALALVEVPDANVTWADGNMRRHHSVDVAVAVAIEGGLITPIVRDAQNKSISAISTEVKDLAARARARKLVPEEFQGGTTSISNLGMFGVTSFDAVINPPQGTILAVGAGQRRPVVRDDRVAIATTMMVTLSVDHRMVDGALGGDLLRAFKRYIEAPLTILS